VPGTNLCALPTLCGLRNTRRDGHTLPSRASHFGLRELGHTGVDCWHEGLSRADPCRGAALQSWLPEAESGQSRGTVETGEQECLF